ncbi:AAA family ATPase [Spirosoma taeanense]|uniref:AAA family ATPase n=1 Tax=Spirosoma taeanense TaxID=2735870 RepID=A0A6M5Y983_9BACT|nr:NB-ARC domain-containing protein [Spirosoma taeanense]QJW90827.1 AAA family ATPase [Spirosoma taeanense]
MRQGKIFTFYSFKGGTGRTMAVVNIAALLAAPNQASFKTSMKALIIDWDLEAPGLHRYLRPHCLNFIEKVNLDSHEGLIDYFIEIKKEVDKIYNNSLTSSQCEEVITSVPLDRYIIRSDISGIYFLKAGSFTEGYAKKISEFKWEELFRRAPYIYKKFADKLSNDYDFTLIDSRTGLTDTSGICTMLLPEKLILVFTPNNQSLEGVVDIGRRATKYRLNSTDMRPLKVYPLPSRIEMAEKELREQWRRGSTIKKINGYQVIFENLFEDIYQLRNIDFTDYFDEIQIQHEPRFSYGEEIAVLDRNQTDRLSMAESYEKFLSRLLSDEMIWKYKKFPNNHNLPDRIPIIGREEELNELMKVIHSRFPIISIHGPAGVGKTILALEIGHLCLERPITVNLKTANFEFIIWISSKNKLDKIRSLNDFFNTIANVMGFSRITQISSSETNAQTKEAAICNLLSSYKVLVIINNLELNQTDDDILTWLKNIPEPSKVLITTRAKHDDIPSWKMHLDGLNHQEQQDLIDKHITSIGLTREYLVKIKEVNELFDKSNGNPKVLELLVGIIKTSTIDDLSSRQHMLDALDSNDTEAVFNFFHEEIWKTLSENAKCILMTIPLFVGTLFIKKDALCEISGLNPLEFSESIIQLIDLNLVRNNNDNRYFVHPITREFGRSKLQSESTFEDNVRSRWINYYMSFVNKTIIREDPKEVYWNVLVSDQMLDLDPEWTSIIEVMKWVYEKRPEELLKFVMLLVHYMDSRFHNQERLMFVQKAIETAETKKEYFYEELLLKIDALGWTYVEENQPERANVIINKGLLKLNFENNLSVDKINALNALGNAWKARSALEAGKDFKIVDELIGQAFRYDITEPWIKFRINMAAGDICVKKNDIQNAASFYEKARNFLEIYGGEGHNYQINPRIGIAFLKMGKLVEAEKTFEELQTLETIPIGKLYGNYGIALVNLVKGDIDGARRTLRNVKEEMNRYTASNILQNLIENLEVDIMKNLTKYQLVNAVIL